MKKIPLLLSLIGFVSAPAFSQVEFGVKMGIQAVDVHQTDIPGYFDTKARISYLVGGFTDISIDPHFSLLMELLFASKGYHAATDIYLDYITLPVLLNYKVFENLYFGVGPEFGYQIRARRKLRGHTASKDFLIDGSFDLGIDAGIEYKPIDFLRVGLRYNYGLSNVIGDLQFTDEQGNVLDVEPKMQNRVLQLYAGYTFSRK